MRMSAKYYQNSTLLFQLTINVAKCPLILPVLGEKWCVCVVVYEFIRIFRVNIMLKVVLFLSHLYNK